SRVILIQSGREVKRWTVAPGAPTGAGGLRLRGEAELDVPADGWVVARVEGDVPLAPVVGDRIHFDVRPFALTNPGFLDRGGNGAYDAPLRPPLLPPAKDAPPAKSAAPKRAR